MYKFEAVANIGWASINNITHVVYAIIPPYLAVGSASGIQPIAGYKDPQGIWHYLSSGQLIGLIGAQKAAIDGIDVYALGNEPVVSENNTLYLPTDSVTLALPSVYTNQNSGSLLGPNANALIQQLQLAQPEKDPEKQGFLQSLGIEEIGSTVSGWLKNPLFWIALAVITYLLSDGFSKNPLKKKKKNKGK